MVNPPLRSTATLANVAVGERLPAATLANVAVGERLRIVAARLDEDVAAWIAAVGLHLGEEVLVLRRAALGGPLHVRTASGGEFAVAREIAACLDVTKVET